MRADVSDVGKVEMTELSSIPIEGFTLEQCLQYQSWRTEVQIIATHLHEWKTAKQEDKGKYETPILQAVAMANQRALKFPVIELPVDIVDPVTSAHLDVPAMIQELISLFSMRLIMRAADVQAEIDELGEHLAANHRKLQNL